MTDFLVTYMRFVDVVRMVLLVVALVLGVACLLDWAVRTRRVSPFSGLARFARSTIDPFIKPVESRVVRAGGSPQSAPLWALGGVVVGGLILIYLLEFIGAQVGQVYLARSLGARGLLRLAVGWAISLLQIAILVRVIGSWVGQNRYSAWVGWSYKLTDWLVEPLRRVIPNIGMIDITPIAAYFALAILRSVILSVI